ncbi:hypothetical protein Poli38472_008063 [Pythium oligandrum]|uniref:Uncharacterized protein n=1 Tax=Pythium oligandrum TaxID=41045 RepID=A0A8K1CKS1_PYTOL|nr:hypothetical protein Poli38472_008063 [Pythium oligandrum]|eukprot:TMW65421.1 hypothetical protein Poli38472_008063 [Pythium oligandrum]
MKMAFGAADFEVSRTPVASKTLQTVAKKAVNEAAKASKGLRGFGAKVKELFEASSGDGWHVLVGADFAVDLRYRKGACVLLSSKSAKTKVLLYRTTRALTPTLKAHDDVEPVAEDDVAAAKRKVVWYESDMPDDMKSHLVRYTLALVAKLTADKAADVDTKLAQTLKQHVSARYGHTWHAIASTSREVCCLPYHEPETLADFSVDKFRIVVYSHNGASVDSQVDLTQLANRATLVLAAMCLIMYCYFNFVTTDTHEECASDKDVHVAADCTEQEIVLANAHHKWKSMTFLGMVAFTVIASFIRLYRRALHQKVKLA